MATKRVCGALTFAGSKQEKVERGRYRFFWRPNDKGTPLGVVISDTSEYESSRSFGEGAKSQSLRNLEFKIKKLALKKASHGEMSI
jgi:hypothetical protein